MKKAVVIVLMSICPLFVIGQVVGIKTNVLYDATSTFNLGLEIGMGKKTSLDISGNYNPWKFSNNRQIKHWLIQPELRWWLCEKFNGHFFGIHGHYAEYNAQGIKLPFGLYKGLRDNRYDGNLYGGGISYGYQWILGNHWGIEASIGVGYAHLKYDRYERGECTKKLETKHKNYVGPTKVALSFIYLIK